MAAAVRKLLRTLGHADWLRLGVRDRVIRFVHDPDTCEPEEFVVPFFGARYAGRFDTFLDWSVFYYGAYAREELRLLDDFLGKIDDPVLLDVGANVGHHTLFAAMRARSVVAFEPFLDVARELRRKVADNGLSNVQLVECGLGERNESVPYAKPDGRNTGTGSFAPSARDAPTVELPVRVGDEVLAERGVTDVHFIKIDTEGFEPFVLKGLRGTLARCRPLVFFEWSQGERKLFNRDGGGLFPPGYRCFEFLPDTVVCGVFRRRTYRLRPLDDAWPDGNLFAVPAEFIERLRADDPGCDAAGQLAGRS